VPIPIWEVKNLVEESEEGEEGEDEDTEDKDWDEEEW
jgi:hypothetical protein